MTSDVSKKILLLVDQYVTRQFNRAELEHQLNTLTVYPTDRFIKDILSRFELRDEPKTCWKC